MPYWYAAAMLVSAAVTQYGESEKAGNESGATKKASDASSRATIDLLGKAGSGNFMGKFGLSDIFGKIPKAALYEEVDPNDITEQSIADLMGKGLPAAVASATIQNRFMEQDVRQNSLNRINALMPEYGASMSQAAKNNQSLINGELPFEDVLGIVSDRSSLAASLGTPGGSLNATLKDLGMSRMQAQQTGQQGFQNLLGTLATSVSPLPNLISPLQMLDYTAINAPTRLSSQIEQNQYVQQSMQNMFNLAAMPHPAASAIFQGMLYDKRHAASLLGGQSFSNPYAGASAALAQGATAYYQQSQANQRAAAQNGGGTTSAAGATS